MSVVPFVVRPFASPLALAAALGLVFAPSGRAATITVLHQVSLSPVVPGGDFTGHTGHAGFPGIYAQADFSAGEAFAGQTVSVVSGYEVVSGAPTGALLVPAAANGVTLYNSGLQGQLGSCGDPCTGEGAVTFSFVDPQSAIGLDVDLFETGTVTAQFFEPDGTPFTPVVLSTGGGSKTFTAPVGTPIGGVTFTNVDNFGVAFDDLRLTPASPVSTDAASWGEVKSAYR